MNVGGTTSINVTRRGIDRAYGIHKLCEHLRIKERDTLFIGDELCSGGADEAVFKTEVETKNVANPAETVRFIKTLLNA